MDYNEMIELLKEDLSEKRFQHSVNTMKEAVELAKKYGVDEDKARKAGLLHDCGKLKNERVGALEHAGLGAKLVKTKYNIYDEDIVNAILYHTTGRTNMSMLEKIVFIADKIESGRDYEGVEELRKEAYLDIDKAIIMSLERTMEYLKEIGAAIDDRSRETLEYLKESCNNM